MSMLASVAINKDFIKDFWGEGGVCCCVQPMSKSNLHPNFTVTFNQFNASLQNKSINFFQKKDPKRLTNIAIKMYKNIKVSEKARTVLWKN